MIGMDETQRPQPNRAHRWDASIKALAFDLWLLKCGRDSVKTAGELAALGHAVPSRTVQEWAHGFTERAPDRFRELAPGISQQTVERIIVGGFDAAGYLQAVNRGEIEPDANRIKASIAILHMAGYSPVGSRNPVQTPDNPKASGPAELLRRYNLVDSSGNARPRPIPQIIDTESSIES